MDFNNLTQEELLKLTETTSELNGALILYLWNENQKFKEEVKELKARLNLNSSNSSKPPSSDGYKKPNPKSLRGKSGKKNGGQFGHKAHQLPLNENPDHVITYTMDQCEKCEGDLKNVLPLEEKVRQVLDFIAKIETTEHRAQTMICPVCQHANRASFPSGVDYKTQYGDQAKSVFSYLSIQQMMPLKRLTETIQSLTGHSVSQGTILRANQELYRDLEQVEAQIKQQLLASPVVHFDESSVRVFGKKHWLHVACTPKLTHYTIHANRGSKAMDASGILPDFKGNAMRDGWKAYRKYNKSGQALCNTHHHRELIGVIENDKQDWGQEMIDLLYDIKKKKEALIRDGFNTMAKEKIMAFETKYRTILDKGFAENPAPPPPIEKKQGKIKQSKTKNLLDRLDQDQAAVLKFMHDFCVPFTNNEAEQAIRMIKVWQKVSGSFRSEQGPLIFCRLRGYFSTVRKQGLPVLKKIQEAFMGAASIPQSQSEN